MIVEEFLSRAPDDGEAFDPNLPQLEWDKLWNRVIEEGGADFIQGPSSDNVAEFLSSTSHGESEANFKGVALHSVQRREFKTWMVKFALAVMSRLAERFPSYSMSVLKALEIFNP